MVLDIKKIHEKITIYKLSKAMNIPITTIYSWKDKGKIPSWRVDSVLVACKKLNIDISDCYKA